MSRIVGRETSVYLTGVLTTYMDGKPSWMITRHTTINELHATKGWRRGSHHRRVFFEHRRRSAKEWRDAHVTTFENRTNGRSANRYGICELQVRP